jgi:Dyp-type peroxidase family
MLGRASMTRRELLIMLGYGAAGAGIGMAPGLAFAEEPGAAGQLQLDRVAGEAARMTVGMGPEHDLGSRPVLVGDPRANPSTSAGTSYDVPLDQVQGNVTPGFRKDHQAFLFLRFPDAAFGDGSGVAAGAQKVQAWLEALRPSIVSARTVAELNQQYREARAQARAAGVAPDTGAAPSSGKALLNVAFTAEGLRALLGEPPSAPDALADAPKSRLKGFLAGMANRNGWTGDDLDDIAAFTVRDSVRGDLEARGNSPDAERAQVAHALVIVGADSQADLETEIGRQIHLAASNGLIVLERATIWGKTLGNGREHFGFTDSRSQPDPDDPLLGWVADGQQTVAPGEFIRGLLPEPRQSQPAETATVDVPAWELHGSYLVVRKLQQDVTGFWMQMEQLATSLQQTLTGEAGNVTGSPSRPSSGEPSAGALFVAAKLLGRWPGGAFVTEPMSPGQPFATDPSGDGSLYKSTPSSPTAAYAQDPHGAGCPLFAHVRKANPRVTSAMVTEEDLRIHRIIRRGIPYVQGDEKGLVFLAYQARIEDGYEHIQREWLNDGYFGTPKGGVEIGEDGTPIIAPGRRGDPPAPGPDPLSVLKSRGGNLQLYLSDVQGQPGQYLPRPFSRVVTARGGGYFFAPSISALELLASGRLQTRQPSLA